MSLIFNKISARFESNRCCQNLSALSRITSFAGFFGLNVRFSSFFTSPDLKCSLIHHCEIGLSPKLYIGEENISNKYFDHSWIGLDNKVIDLAVALPLDYSDSVDL